MQATQKSTLLVVNENNLDEEAIQITNYQIFIIFTT